MSREQARARATAWWPFLAVIAAYAAVALQQITLPGVYMDAVNPDYMAVSVLNRHGEPITAWLLPGNYLAQRYPVLISFYHGSQQFCPSSGCSARPSPAFASRTRSSRSACSPRCTRSLAASG